jgi:hypothetical protein
MSHRAILACVLSIPMLLPACAEQRGTDAPPLASQALLSAIGMAQALQHESDVHELRGEIPLAIESARRVLDVPFPSGAAEREDVRLDAFGRMAELELLRADTAAAETQANLGVAEATRDSYFRARLHVVLGRVHEVRAEHLRETGDEAGARTESEAAITELERSIAINRVVLGIGTGASTPGGETP